MTEKRHPVLLFSLALSCLFFGAGGTWYFLNQSHQKLLGSPDFLRKKLDQLGGDSVAKPSGRPPSLIRVTQAREERIGTIREFFGQLVEVQLAKISSEVSGLVIDLPIEVGMRVQGGATLIAQTDRTWLELTLEQTEAEIKILEAQYAHQTSELERLVNAANTSRGAVSESELNNQRTLTEQFLRNLEKARITNRETKEKLKRTTILAPFDGYVVKREVGLGELLSPGTPIAEIVSLGEVDARVLVGEQFINRIKVDDEIPLMIDQLEIKVVGTVRSVVPYAPTAARSFPLLVRLDDKNGLLKVGMSVTALVQTTDPRDCIVVSKDAVLDKPDGSTVWVVVEEGEAFVARPVPVKITVRESNAYGVRPETEEGFTLLHAGSKTVIEGAERLFPNQKVRIVEINPEHLENLPPKTGHKIIPKDDNESRADQENISTEPDGNVTVPEDDQEDTAPK